MEKPSPGRILGRHTQAHQQLPGRGAVGEKLGQRLIAKRKEQQYAVRLIELDKTAVVSAWSCPPAAPPAAPAASMAARTAKKSGCPVAR